MCQLLKITATTNFFLEDKKRKTMKPSNVKLALTALIRKAPERAVFLWGPPGVGKSDVVKSVADNLSMQLKDIRAILLDPVDFRGVPSVKNGTTIWNVPDFLPKSGKGIMFLDELNAAPQSVQAACYQLILDRQLGDYTLPEGWVIIAAGNREGDKAVVNRMPTALANRFIHIDFAVDLDDWQEWACSHAIRPEITSFINWRKELLHSFDPKSSEKSFPTPRSWAFVSDVLGTDMPKIVEYDMVQGTVGEGAAAEFMSFLTMYRDLPDPAQVLANPTKAAIPQKSSVLYALTGAIQRIVTAKDGPNLFKLADRIADEVTSGGAEFGLLLVKGSLKSCADLLETKPYIDWTTKHAKEFI